MRVLAIVTTAALAACGTDHMSGADGGGSDSADANVPSAPCWPGPLRTTKVSATLGTGREGFEDMPQELPLEYGTQDGYNLVAHVRASGIFPGSQGNHFDPVNPRTRIRAFFDESNVPLNYYSKCPFRNWYVPTANGEYELFEAVPIIFETCWRPMHLFGKRIRIELDVVDDTGAYATDVKIVTAVAPTTFYPMEGPSEGCLHRPEIVEH